MHFWQALSSSGKRNTCFFFLTEAFILNKQKAQPEGTRSANTDSWHTHSPKVEKQAERNYEPVSYGTTNIMMNV